MSKKVSKSQEITEKFLEKLGVNASAKVSEIEDYLKIEIDGKDASLLIGFHGENLQALRHLISIILRKELNENISVTVDVANYLAKKEERIQAMAQRAADKFEATGEPQSLRELTPFERRIVHGYLTEKGFKSESVGEGYDRYIVVSK